MLLYAKDDECERPSNVSAESLTVIDIDGTKPSDYASDILMNAAGSSCSENQPSSIKQNASWTSNATKALISLYEANKHMLENPRKKSKIWTAISMDLKDYVEVTPDQVRWKFNRLHDRYKKCIDNNKKTGSAPMTFEFYDAMDEIFTKDKNNDSSYVISSELPIAKKVTKDQSSQKENTGNLKNFKSSNIKSSTSNINSSNATTSTNISKPKHGIGSQRTKVKAELEQEFSHLLKSLNDKQTIRDDRSEKLLKLKVDALQIKKRQIDIRDKEVELKKTLANKKLKSKEQRHEEIMEIEKLKCKILTKLQNSAASNSDESD